MNSFRYSLVAAISVAAIVSLTITTVSVAEDEQPFIDVLQSDAPKAEKAITCKKLAIWGTQKAVPALAALLPDPELSSWSRIALEVIPGSAADQALREAMGKLEGRILIGVINSIGVRRDAAAVDGLAKRLHGSDADVASAAAVALGRIGNKQAIAELRKALPDVSDAVRSSVAEGCLLCAEKLLAAGNAQDASRLYDEVRAAKLPKQRIVEATRGAILARRTQGISLLIEQLKSRDEAMVSVGLMTARELSGPGVSKALVDALADLSPHRQALVIIALADRGDREVMPVMLDAARTGTSQVRIAAIRFLKQLGNVSVVPVLLEVASEDNADVAASAQSALEALPGKDVDAALAARLDQARGKTRRVLIELVGRRRIAAVPTLLAAMDDADPQIRAAALIALGEVVTLDDLSALIKRVVSPRHAEDAEVAGRALRTASVRMPDREACAAKLAAALADAPVPAKTAILEALGAMGGTKALQTIASAAKDKDPELQDTATRLLGTWMTLDAAPVLLDLARTLSNNKYRIRALRGYIRIARQLKLSANESLRMCQEAMHVATRIDEKKLVLDVLRRHPSPESLSLAVSYLDQQGLKGPVSATAVGIAEKIVKSHPAAVADAMQHVIEAGVGAKITNRAKSLLQQATNKK